MGVVTRPSSSGRRRGDGRRVGGSDGFGRPSIARASVDRSIDAFIIHHSSVIGHRSRVVVVVVVRRETMDHRTTSERAIGRVRRLARVPTHPSIVVVNVVVVRIIESNAVPTFIHPRRQTTDGRRTSSSASSVRVLVRARRRRPSRRRDERDERRSDDDRTTTSIGRRDRETDDAIVI